ncbi:dihydroxyacetone kinase subunit DhaL [Paludifilum halophilum]|uniref:phosphoenolpyruvate--glycerone phosphotransferase n=1 Tax=Paludifilum halophilum TaxID=1642702 RepID=A0A235B696_9BACL|nr:dihydroxyacetone kinase subunit DhaL [Paludifilum halophilum]OYD07417.1 dihydroxyacetone kinase subunit L [Paludifilum halophilum]
MHITASEFKSFLHRVTLKVEEKKDDLSELDRKLGDGDHGVTMSLGWQAIEEKLHTDLKDETDCGYICKEVGKAFINAVGSSVGPLYATGFLRGSRVLQNKSELTDDDLSAFWVAFIDGIQQKGKAEIGEKTMIDTFMPARNTLQERITAGDPFESAFEKAVQAGKKGMESTRDLISKKGRSSRLGSRSVGHQDPGATSAYLMLEVFLSTVRSAQRV